MRDRPPKILVVEPDADIMEMLVASLSRRFRAHVTCVNQGCGCLDVELYDPHDLIITEMDLSDVSGIQLADEVCRLRPRPVFLLAEEPTADEALAALRVGVTDVFCKPFPLEQLLRAAKSALRGYERVCQQQVRYHQMRQMVRSLIDQRRTLNDRLDLVCRDLVGAHRRLVHRVLESEDSLPSAGGPA